MKTSFRIVCTLPFMLAIVFFAQYFLPEEKCVSLVSGITMISFYLSLSVTGIIALIAAFRKRVGNKIPFEPISFSILLISIAVLCCIFYWNNIFKSGNWLVATMHPAKSAEILNTLHLRKDNSYAIELSGIDISCTYTGKYSIAGDTITLEKNVYRKTDGWFTEKYLHNDNMLQPITDSDKATQTLFIIANN
jgi:hypothetical protein